MNYKLYKLGSLALFSSIFASTLHYTFIMFDIFSLRIVFYSIVCILTIMGIVLGDAISIYFGLEENDDSNLVCGVVGTFIFIGGIFRAFCFGDNVEGYFLLTILCCFWLVMFFVYIKLLMFVTTRKID